MCNVYNAFTYIILPIIGAILPPVLINKWQYKNQKDNNLIIPRINFKKNFDQILTFEAYIDSLYFNKFPEYKIEIEIPYRAKHIYKYNTLINDLITEAYLLLDQEISKDVVDFLQKIKNCFENHNNSSNPAKIFPRGDSYMEYFFETLSEENPTLISKHKEIGQIIRYFIHSPKETWKVWLIKKFHTLKKGWKKLEKMAKALFGRV